MLKRRCYGRKKSDRQLSNNRAKNIDIQKHYTRGEIMKARQSSSMGLIIRQKEPNNLETPFDQVDAFLTPRELFYIRSLSRPRS